MNAKETLSSSRFATLGQLEEAVNSLLDHPDRKQALGRLSYAYPMDMAWPKTGERCPALLRLALSRSVTAPRWPAA